MAILPRLTTVPPVREPVNPQSPTEDELADLCVFVKRSAVRAYLRSPPSTATPDLAEFEDCGMVGLEYAWQTWTPALGIPFVVIAKLNIVRRMRKAKRTYATWRYPTSGMQATRPRRTGVVADILRPPRWTEAIEDHERRAWFHAEVTSHRRCFTAQNWHALQDCLAETPYEEIAARDHLNVKDARRRQWRLLKFLRQHVFGGETSCTDEQYQRQRWPGHGRIMASLAAAD